MCEILNEAMPDTKFLMIIKTVSITLERQPHSKKARTSKIANTCENMDLIDLCALRNAWKELYHVTD